MWLRDWYKSYGDFAGLADFSAWWISIGEGHPLYPTGDCRVLPMTLLYIPACSPAVVEVALPIPGLQVMWPSLYLAGGRASSLLHSRVESLARQLLGPDMVFDFDMLISKEAGSLAETPWHQVHTYKIAQSFSRYKCIIFLQHTFGWYFIVWTS